MNTPSRNAREYFNRGMTVQSGQSDPMNTAVARQAARLLIQRAISLFDIDQDAARSCLGMAASLLIGRTDDDCESSRKVSRSLTAWQAKRVLDYVDSHLDSKLGVEELARLLALSKSYFARSFKQRLGMPPMSFVAIRRVERAKALMKSTQEPLTAIALTCGFGDQSHLTRWFRRVVGTTPGQFRRGAHRGAPSASSLPAEMRTSPLGHSKEFAHRAVGPGASPTQPGEFLKIQKPSI